MSRVILKYPGAKNRIAPWICEHIPDHKVYVEPFLGSAAVFLNKEPAYNEILNDLDGDVYNFFKVLRDYPEDLARQLELTPYSRAEYNAAYINAGQEDSLEKARAFAVKCWQGFGCGNKYKNGFRRGIGETSPNPAKAWDRLPVSILIAAKRFKNAQMENKGALELIKTFSGHETLIYCDPPYLQSTRKKYLYNYEMTDEQHIELLEALASSSCRVLISGYDNDLYSHYLAGWHKAYKNTTAECSVRRTECLWYNYDEDNLFHHDNEDD